MKKPILSIITIFALLLSPAYVPAVAESSDSPAVQAEINRAAELGLIAEGEDPDKTISFADFFAKLDRIVVITNPSAISNWRNDFVRALSSEQEMTRADGMAAVYFAALAIGGEHGGFNDETWDLHGKMGDPWDAYAPSEGYFPRLHDPSPLNEEWGNAAAAYFYSFKRLSALTRSPVFDYDESSNSMRVCDPLTYREATLAALRLYESGMQGWHPDARDAQIIQDADKRREDILTSVTDIVAKNTAYYVSNDGDDRSDGKSPLAPWSSLEKVNQAKLEPGDVVFFERGGLWRGRLAGQPYVSYSAYGEGEKPRIIGSQENGASSEKWKLLDGTQSIWVFHEEMPDCGIVLFDEGKSWASKAWAWWDGERYRKSWDQPEMPFDVREMNNSSFFVDVDLTGFDDTINDFLMMHECDRKGKLYLRCDEGNPGEIYTSIEFSNNNGTELVYLAEGGLLDNLCIMLNGNCGVSMHAPNTTIQNCEIAWMGGAVWAYKPISENPWDFYGGAGDGIMFNGSGSVADHNYIHDCYQCPFTIETGFDMHTVYGHDEKTYYENLVCRKNLFENNQGGLLIANFNPDDRNHVFRDILIEDNYFLRSGYGWSAKDQSPQSANHAWIQLYNDENTGIEIRNNVFYLTTAWLLEFGMPEKYMPDFSGNVYAQNNMKGLIRWWKGELGDDSSEYFYWGLDAQDVIRDFVGDEEAIVLQSAY